MNSNPTVKSRRRPASQPPPWLLDVPAARKTALQQAKPFVLILNIDSGAL
jgi:hypothetical protein